MTTDRIVFANLLRGVGAFSVLISHFVGIFWLSPPDINALMGVPVLPDFPALPDLVALLAKYCIVFGQFGVGVFFIVSGLVIPFSLQHVSRSEFLKRRAIRIYPVYIVGFCFVMCSLYLLANHIGVPYKFSLGNILAHFGVITRGPLGVERIDGISWTLEVEIYFYLVMCVIGTRVLNFNCKQYIKAALVIAVLSFIAKKAGGFLIGVQVASGLLLLLGTAYYAVLKQRLELNEFWRIQWVIAGLMSVLLLAVLGRGSYVVQWLIGDLLAMAVFYACFKYRHRIKENWLLSHLADISYPLYVVHALFGYSIMYVMIRNGFGVYSAIAAACAAAYLAALLLHLLIEKPSMAWSKALGKPKASLQGS